MTDSIERVAVGSANPVKLGAVRSLNGSASAPPMPMYRQQAVMADAAEAPEATYQPGEMKFSASVGAEYDLVVGP